MHPLPAKSRLRHQIPCPARAQQCLSERLRISCVQSDSRSRARSRSPKGHHARMATCQNRPLDRGIGHSAVPETSRLRSPDLLLSTGGPRTRSPVALGPGLAAPALRESCCLRGLFPAGRARQTLVRRKSGRMLRSWPGQRPTRSTGNLWAKFNTRRLSGA